MAEEDATTGSRLALSVALLATLLVSPAASFATREQPDTRGGDAAAPRRAPAPAASATPSAYCLQRFLEPFAEALGTDMNDDGGGVPDVGPWQGDVGELAAAAIEARRGRASTGTLEAIVATVADPIDSALAYKFDTALQALRLGLEYDLGPEQPRYYRDRAWLPWDDRERSDAQDTASKECRSSLPGVLLFRADTAGAPRHLAVLLVGETPGSGVHKTAMWRALQIATSINGEQARELAILGPSFSGSAQSLRVVLREWASGAHSGGAGTVRVTTGSATGSALPAQLSSTFDGLGALRAPKQVSFSATTLPEADLQCAYLEFLARRLGVLHTSGAPAQLPAVAIMHESGTEFGAAAKAEGARDRAASCPFAAGAELSFPAHISQLRDAYENMDRGAAAGAATITSPTSLAISLKDAHLPLELEVPSAKTTFARDVALASVLGTISRTQIRHVGIQATDISDAIFLARRIRYISPDVRIAFFAADVLLLHNSFERDLEGSLVVSPYPFLGTSSLHASAPARARTAYEAFESSASEGLFNAVLAARGARLDQLREYAVGELSSVLPIWVAAITPGALVPISAMPHRNAAWPVALGTAAPPRAPATLERDSTPGPHDTDSRRIEEADLTLAANTRLPRSWHFAFGLLLLLSLGDGILRRNARDELSKATIDGALELELQQRNAELAIGRAKWSLYAAFRTHALTFASTYMAALYCLALQSYTGHVFGRSFADEPGLRSFSRFVLAAIVLLSWVASALAAHRFVKDYCVLGRCVSGKSLLVWLRSDRRARAAGAPRARRSAIPPGAPLVPSVRPLAPHPASPSARRIRSGLASAASRAPGALAQVLGWTYPSDGATAAHTSFAQLRLLSNFAALVALFFSAGTFVVIVAEIGSRGVSHAVPGSTLFVSRSLTLIGGASPSAPVLVCAALVYLWSAGRMARLELVSGLCRMSPAVEGLVSTPIRTLLFPDGGASGTAAGAFATVERRVFNAILRPLTGWHYAAALGTMAFLPVLLFALKPPSTLEHVFGTLFLAACIGLSALVIGSTLIQLVQYWVALELLLKLVLQHRLGRAFSRVAPFVRGSVSDQISRSPHAVLRFGSCVTRFDELVRAAQPLGPDAEGLLARAKLSDHRDYLFAARDRALAAAAVVASDRADAAATEAELGRALVKAASAVMCIVIQAWDGTLAMARHTGGAAPASDSQPALSDEALSAAGWRYTPQQLHWLREAEAFGATVTAILIHRHVRQFHYFMWTLTACALLLLLAVASYPFEPHRLLFTCIWALVGSVVLTGFWVYLELDRNSLISRIAGTTPGRFTWDWSLAGRVLAFGVIPLLSVAAMQYPDLANRLFHMVEPFTRALR